MSILKVVNTGSHSGNSYIVKSNGKTLLLDAGAKYKDILRSLDYSILDLSGVLLTHAHKDHTKSGKDFITSGIPTFGHVELKNHLDGIISVPEKKRFKAGEFLVVPFYVPHTTRSEITGEIVACPNYAYLIFLPNGEKLLYATDFEFIPVTFKSFKIEHWLIECNHIDEIVDHDTGKYEHVLKGHSSLSTVKDVIKTNKHDGMKNIILCHLSSENAHEERMVREIQEIVPGVNIFVAEKGLEVNLC